MFITATIPNTVSGTPTQAGRACTPISGKVNVCTQTPKPVGIAAASDLPAELLPPRQAAEVVDRADGRRHGRAEQDAAQLAAQRQERERRHEHAEEDRQPAEARDRRPARSPSVGRSTSRR